MPLNPRKCSLIFAGLALFAASHAAAQESAPVAQPIADGQDSGITWSDPEFAEIAGMLTGSWKTTAAVAQADDRSLTSEVVMSIAPVKLTQLPDALYAETSRADTPAEPYRAVFLQLYRRQGEIRMRTLEVRDQNNPINNMMLGLWAVPEYFPNIPAAGMIATLDLEFRRTSNGWVAETPHPYPTALHGATEMTSRMTLTADRVETADRGYNPDGNVVWGADDGDTYVFEPINSPILVETNDYGLITLTLRDEPTEVPVDGDTVAFQYTGWLTNGFMFDTSRRPNGRPYQYQLPANAIEGWNQATKGMSQGDWRKFIVPSDLGYGPSTAAGGRIPANSTLVFEAELANVVNSGGE